MVVINLRAARARCLCGSWRVDPLRYITADKTAEKGTPFTVRDKDEKAVTPLAVMADGEELLYLLCGTF